MSMLTIIHSSTNRHSLTLVKKGCEKNLYKSETWHEYTIKHKWGSEALISLYMFHQEVVDEILKEPIPEVLDGSIP